VTLPDGTTIRPTFVLPPEWEEIAKKGKKTAFTVTEAVEQFGLSRDDIMAKLEKNREEFVVDPGRGERTPNCPPEIASSGSRRVIGGARDRLLLRDPELALDVLRVHDCVGREVLDGGRSLSLPEGNGKKK
jgi:hypothetical protein